MFKDFPHQSLVYPVIYDYINEIACSCTVIWLIQHRNKYTHSPQATNELENDSVQKCTKQNFNESVKNCNFPQRINECIAENPNKCPQFAPQCFCDGKNGLECSNFTSFSQLNLNNYNVKEITLHPIEPSLLDENFNLAGLTFNEDNTVEISLVNLLGFDLRSDFFKERTNIYAELTFEQSNFDVYFKSNLLEAKDCRWDLLTGDFSNIFKNISKLSLEFSNSSSKVCPLAFKNSHIDTFNALIVTNNNYLEFMQMPDIAGQTLNSRIRQLSIVYSDLYLSSKFISKHVFANVEEIIFEFTNLQGIEANIFKSFEKLKSIQLGITDVTGFIKNGTTWLNSINPTLNVDLTNPADIQANKQRSVAVFFEGINNSFNYSDDNFCLFKDFPHRSMVYPVILDENEMPCTCLIIWLIQYRYRLDVSPEMFEAIKSDSVHKCYNEDFSSSIKSCDFNEKIKNCANNNSNNTLDAQLAEKNRKISQLTIATSVLGSLLLVVVILFVIIFIKFRRAKQLLSGQKASFSFSPITKISEN